jgi:hypothetical protein
MANLVRCDSCGKDREYSDNQGWFTLLRQKLPGEPSTAWDQLFSTGHQAHLCSWDCLAAYAMDASLAGEAHP